MGIPLDYTPPASRTRPSAGSGARTSADASPKPPTDPTAAGRSSIRRNPHFRRTASRLHTARRSNGTLDPRDRHLVIEPVARAPDRDRSSDRDPSLPRIARNPLIDYGGSVWDNVEIPSSIGRREIGRRLLRDSVNYSSPGRRMRIPRNLLGQDMPPLSVTHASRHSASYSPRFAPAHPEDSAIANGLEIGDSSSTEGTMDASMPLLRRVGHRSVATARNSPPTAPTPTFSLDGIFPSDRELSRMSMDDEVPDVSDTWARLLNTIPLDNNLPSADSSFTSATASASASASRSSTAAPTSLTPSSSFGSSASSRMHIMFDPFPSFSANCDFISSSENSDTEADEAIERYQNRMRNRSRAQLQSQAQAQSDSNTPPDSSAPTASSFTLENEAAGLQLLHDTLNLLSRRDDIPDEWWATAGLTRIINRELNRERNAE